MYVLLEMSYIHLDGGVKWWQIGKALHTGSWLTFITTSEIKLDMMKSEISAYLCSVQSCQELERYFCKISFLLLCAHNQVEDEDVADVRSGSPMTRKCFTVSLRASVPLLWWHVKWLCTVTYYSIKHNFWAHQKPAVWPFSYQKPKAHHHQ